MDDNSLVRFGAVNRKSLKSDDIDGETSRRGGDYTMNPKVLLTLIDINFGNRTPIDYWIGRITRPSGNINVYVNLVHFSSCVKILSRCFLWSSPWSFQFLVYPTDRFDFWGLIEPCVDVQRWMWRKGNGWLLHRILTWSKLKITSRQKQKVQTTQILLTF